MKKIFCTCFVAPSVFFLLFQVPFVVSQDLFPENSESTVNITQYTQEEFDNLTIEEQRETYFSDPTRLPLDFDAEKYTALMHGNESDTPSEGE